MTRTGKRLILAIVAVVLICGVFALSPGCRRKNIDAPPTRGVMGPKLR